MHPGLNQLLVATLSLSAGTMIGLFFGTLQKNAVRRHQQLQQSGKLNNGWMVMPGSMRRVAYLLMALAIVQFACPMLFSNGCQWWVSGGVVAGYGWTLFKQLRERLSQQR